ncbi:unnamed protein product [Bodo saltans]|uniref:Uncharacterized protein n=1 Tax=Bodo saltans TaxID=75058 RepID=A0A0S4IJ94_BODSA|nr:unnamed protein product [Bodo saltans]|eukprot:CUE77265.1 unnamed protein product [Bodo saltans]
MTIHESYNGIGQQTLSHFFDFYKNIRNSPHIGNHPTCPTLLFIQTSRPPPQMTRGINQSNTVTIKSALRKANIPFDENASRETLIQKYRDARTVNLTLVTPTAQRLFGSTDNDIAGPHSFLEEQIKEIDALMSKGLITADIHKRQLELLLQQHYTPSPSDASSFSPPPLVISELGERKREFFALRERHLGKYETPYPSAELREFMLAFPSSPTFHADDELRGFYSAATNHYRHYYTLVQQNPLPPSRFPQEPFLDDFRSFLGYIAAIFWLHDMAFAGNKRIGGVAYSFSCRPTLLAEDLQNIQRGPGTDIISKYVNLARQHLPNNHTNTNTNTNVNANIVPVSNNNTNSNTNRQETPKRARDPTFVPCTYCLGKNPRAIVNHTYADCRKKISDGVYTPTTQLVTHPPPYQRPPSYHLNGQVPHHNPQT